MLCLIKVNSNTNELTVHTSCYRILDLLCAKKKRGIKRREGGRLRHTERHVGRERGIKRHKDGDIEREGRKREREIERKNVCVCVRVK